MRNKGLTYKELRRFTGDFWTPKIWVDQAHEMISEQLGEDWKEKYVVWEASCGTKNLTRDYQFAELYNSTLHQEELDISADYNPEARETFQYDFLNDDIHLHTTPLLMDRMPAKMPKSLYNALKENKPIVFFMNPPYGQATTKVGSHKTKASINSISELVNFGKAGSELYCQFIYRTMLLAETFNYKKDFHFFYYSKVFITSTEFADFMKYLCNRFTFKKGFMFNAGEFHGTSSAWGILFSHWQIGGSEQPKFKFEVLHSKNNHIENICDYNAYSAAEFSERGTNTIKDWFDEIRVRKEEIDFVPISSGFNLREKAGTPLYKGAIGNIQMQGNTVQRSEKFTTINSAVQASTRTNTITPQNFERACIAFSVRKAIFPIIAEQKLLWVRDKDVFRKPSDEFQQSSRFAEFTSDCVVYSLFASGSNQTSLRDFQYNGKKHRINNEFFWLPKRHIEQLAREHRNLEIKKDASTDTERFVYKWLKEHETDLSHEAKELLEIAAKIIDESFKYRYNYTYEQNNDKFNLQSWDAGWLQIYKMIASQDADKDAKEALKERYADFRKALRKLGDKITKSAEQDGMI